MTVHVGCCLYQQCGDIIYNVSRTGMYIVTIEVDVNLKAASEKNFTLTCKE